MAGVLLRAEQYRARADEIRAVAEWMKDFGAKRQLLKTASDYEAMADSIERIEKTHDLDSPPKV